MSEESFHLGLAALRRGDAAAAVPALEAAARDGHALARFNLGLALIQTGRLAGAEAALRAAVAALPGRPEPLVYLGQVVGIRGQMEEARSAFEAALALDPGQMLALVGLAGITEAIGDLDGAAALLDRAHAIAPAEAELQAWRARIATRRGAPALALEAAMAASAANPESIQAAKQAAIALLALHGPEAALQTVEDGATAEPLSLRWPLIAALLRAMRGDLDGALAELRLAEALAPESPTVQGELGLALAAADQREEAIVALRRALARAPNELSLRNRLATLLSKSYRFAEAEAMLQAALTDLGPDPVPLMNLALMRNSQGRQEEAVAAADEAVSLSGGTRDTLVTRLFVLAYHPRTDAALLRREAEAAAARHTQPQPIARPVDRDPARPLRLGLLSGNFGAHPVGWLTIAGFEALPETAFEIACYSLRRRDDMIARRFRARAAIWREMGAADEAAIAAMMAADGIDILVDLAGYGDGGRPGVAARRAAPVQVKWVGAQSTTTGLPAMDWMLTDRWETPPGFERFYTERLLRLPDGYVCYAPPPHAPDVAPPPVLANGHVTFGCYNNLAKVTPGVLAAWARILAAVPGSRLSLRTHALGDASVREALVTRLVAAGIDPERVAMHGKVSHTRLLAAYGEIDIALDPFPYAGGLTVCEALYMGVPVVSLYGDGFAMRHGLSHLSNVGLADWSVGDVEAYVALAIARARDEAGLVALRAGLRQRVLASPLCDAPRFGRGLAAALRHAWEVYCMDGETRAAA
jgi:predicted O-linked N-acetylglucosamine transferase (SPINDLY family)